MAGLQNQMPNTDLFDAYFRRADLDGDGQISGAEAVAFFQGSNLPKQVLAQVWTHADQRKAGFLNQAEFYNALKLVTVAQSKRELTPDMVKAALYGPASAKIPAPQINLAATPAPQSRVTSAFPPSGGSLPASSQSIGISRPPHSGNATVGQQFLPSQQNQFMRPPQALPPGISSQQQHLLASQGAQKGGIAPATRPQNSGISTHWVSASSGGPLPGATPQVPNRGTSPSTTQDGFGLTPSSVQLRPPATTGQTISTALKPQDPAMPSNQLAQEPKTLVVLGNGSASGSDFGDLFSLVPSQSKQISSAGSSSAVSLPVSTAIVPAAVGPQPSVKATAAELSQNLFTQQPLSGQFQQGQSTGKQNQVVAAQSTTSTSTGFSVGFGNSASSNLTPPQLPWPRMTQSDIQKYTKVFVQVDIDRDGKITGEQARNLFLSWRLPREVLKQVWDLSDQDNDSMLSLREFCTALYLMERFREGHPLPTVLPSSIVPDETLLSSRGQPTGPHGNPAWASAPGTQQPHVTPSSRGHAAGGRPPRPLPVPQADGARQPSPQKPKIPVVEKHLVDQLSNEERDSLNLKFQEAAEADKKVEELEKEIATSKEKIEFYRAKMQELILFKSRCDNRLNEITERVSADKREVESLSRKYEDKYKEVGDVASKLTIEEATFRDVQERKMELYQAIVKMEGNSAEGTLQDRADRIQSSLEELVKTVNERCKQYGLRAKPTSLVELPFGWQPGIQGGGADWDEDWDKFHDEGTVRRVTVRFLTVSKHNKADWDEDWDKFQDEEFTFVKELTLDVQNVIAPPKPKFSSVQKEKTSKGEGVNDSLADANVKSEKVPSEGGKISENEMDHDQSKDGLARSPPDSPAAQGEVGSQSDEFRDSQFRSTADASPRARDTLSDHGGAESVVSGERTFDEPSWGTFDTHYDTESVWGFDPVNTKDTDNERHGESSMFGFGDFDLKPIRTEMPRADNPFPGISSSIFADSVPSTPAYNFGNSPQRFNERSDELSFDNFSRFDSFSMQDGGLFNSPRHLARFDSVRSSRDSDHNYGFSSRFDSFNAQDSGFFQSPRNSLSPRNSFARFDSMRSTRDSDHSHSFPSFDEPDPFGSSGPFKSSVESQTPRRGSDGWSAF